MYEAVRERRITADLVLAGDAILRTSEWLKQAHPPSLAPGYLRERIRWPFW